MGSAVGNGGTLSTGGGSGICVFNAPGNTSNLNIHDPNLSSNQRYGIDVAASFTTQSVRLTGVGGSGNGSGLVNTSNVVGWLPVSMQKGSANSCGTGFACVGVPN